MDGRKTCKGCGTVVVKPIICNLCNVASHLGCLSRTGHSHSNGQFTDCEESSITSQICDANSTLMTNIKELLRTEFNKLREEIREMYRSDMAEIKENIRNLSTRVDQLEDLIENSQRVGSSELIEEELIMELEERQKRSLNLIFFNLDEAEENTCTDEILAGDIINRIIPGDTPAISTWRLGKRQQGRARPLRVSLPSKDVALRILRNKFRYSGPVKISQDQTVKQKKHFKDLQAQLKLLRDAGDKNKSIRYKNGVPRIVNSNTSARSLSKN
ncbi:unnamed protein product [Lasius platythorax]|uniref:Uncharacterized protein n=1 Tax=Lasius platythorax TaxID=488582 RepID=A0AAV2MZY3_9HYME